MDDTGIICVEDLRRRYGTGRSAFEAVCGVSCLVRRGELFALLGTNGAERTSTMEVLEGLALPGTARNSLSSAASKLGAANRHEAVRVAQTHGWI
jgi:ABC-type multidrug transport system ATPase subunit